ncbi:MAG: SDR family NAD(P)-dependent oxidoreductase [Myxococcota bacterium]|nr:SDR family NAD(P)-dependent oxidoreductase [Myxococcota bacterium]
MARTALVTGGTSGIGLELVRALAAEGAQVLTCGSREKLPDELVGLANVAYRSCDLALPSERAELVAWVKEQAPHLDLLVNNAGIQIECRIDPELDVDGAAREIAINLLAPIELAAGLSDRVESAGGTIVNVSSGLALAPKAASPVYCATKAGLSSFSRTLRYQLEPRGVRVLDVITPLVRTPMTEGRNDDAMEPEDCSRQILRAVRAGRSDAHPGKAKLLAAIFRISPALARRIMRNA